MKYPTPYWMFVQDLSELGFRMGKPCTPFRIHQSGLSDYLWKTVGGIKPHYITLRQVRRRGYSRHRNIVEGLLNDRHVHLLHVMLSTGLVFGWCLTIRPDSSQTECWTHNRDWVPQPEDQQHNRAWVPRPEDQQQTLQGAAVSSTLSAPSTFAVPKPPKFWIPAPGKPGPPPPNSEDLSDEEINN